ncbi:TetR/AcrR family transcriptional regulator [Chitinophaga pendula]|uniref:TetR/AcrR family transcriptional regulator n=1 Tax=Chitinophaga TaxID=79328 RepID=UPI0018E04442|nr:MULTISPECIES: TetR/AcrR family transcriptional regulator [Chitinophaga]UCJ09063.1 TetR/AcrR family transcriptional regulator [Chitinophaga pendula]
MKKGEKTRQHIIEQAAPIFNERGIAGTTVDDVLAAASVARGCLYNLFDDREDLARQTVDHLLQLAADNIRARLRSATTAKKKIYAYLDLHKAPLDFHVKGGCPILNIGVEVDDHHPVIRQRVKEAVLEAQQAFAGILKKGIQAGEWLPALKADAFAFKMFAAMEGAIVLCRILETNKPMQALIKGFKEELASFEPGNTIK